MVICKTCGQAFDSMKTKHVCPGLINLNRPATMKDIQELQISMAAFRADVLQMLAKMAREQR